MVLPSQRDTQWNLTEGPPLVSNHLTKILICSSVSQIAISETSRKWPPPVGDHLSLTPREVAYGRFHSNSMKATQGTKRNKIFTKVHKTLPVYKQTIHKTKFLPFTWMVILSGCHLLVWVKFFGLPVHSSIFPMKRGSPPEIENKTTHTQTFFGE